MGVSRPTFARIYAKARQKMALALVESREIISVYGNAFFDKDWFHCQTCQSKFNLPREMDQAHCPLCHSVEITQIRPLNK